MVQDTSTLKGKTIAITRPYGQAEEAAKMIEKRGGKPYLIPAIEIKGPSDLKPIKKFIDELQKEEIDYVIFMSVNGVRYLLSAAESLRQLDETLEGLKKPITIAVGRRTAQELKTRQIHVNLVPAKYSSDGIIQSLQQLDISGKAIRIPRTSGATPTLKEKLGEMGALVQEVYVYESVLPIDPNLKEKFFQDLTAEKIDAIIFGSALCVKNLFQMLNEQVSPEKLRDLMNSKLTIVAIGPVTAEALVEMGVKVDVMPDKHLFEEALIVLTRYWNAG
jgi:uroporphyrinogen-III synthase